MIRYFPVPDHAVDMCGMGYVFRAGADGAVVHLTALMPQLQVMVEGGMNHRLGLGSGLDCPAVTVVGATHAASEIVIAPHSRLYGVSLTPPGWESAVGAGARILADRITEAAAIWGERAQRTLHERTATAPDDQAAVEALWRFVVAQAARRGAARDPRHAVIARWIERAGGASIDALASRLDLSHRQTERLTSALLGAPPKQLAMKYRTLRLSAEIALGAPVPAAESDGFYDQAHLIRNFRRYAGCTPRQFQQERGAFARELLVLRWQAGARSALSLWS